MTHSSRRARYRTDSAFRAAILASNHRSRERGGEYRKRMDALASTISRVRDSLDARLRHAERLDKRLLDLLEERKALRRIGPQSRRIGPSAIGRSGAVVCDGEGGERGKSSPIRAVDALESSGQVRQVVADQKVLAARLGRKAGSAGSGGPPVKTAIRIPV